MDSANKIAVSDQALITVSARLNAVAFYMVAALLMWVPLPLAGNRPWAWSLIESWILLTFIVWLCSAMSQPRLGLCRLRPYWVLLSGLGLVQLLVLFQLVPLPIEFLSTISPQLDSLASNLGFSAHTLSLDPGQSAVSLFKGGSYLLFCGLLLMLCDSTRRVKIIVYSIIASAVFQAVYGSIELLSGLERSILFQVPMRDWARGSFIYKNQFANFLALAGSVAFGFLITQLTTQKSQHNKSRIYIWLDALSGPKLIVRLSLILMVIALVLSRSRMGNSAFFISMTLTSVLALLFYKHKPKALGMLVVSLFVLDLLIVGTWFGLEKVKERLEATALTAETRDEVVENGSPIITDFPMVGTGAGSFYSTFPSYHSFGYGGFYDHAHNDYLQFAIEYGLPATACLGFTLFYALAISYQTYSRRDSPFYKGVSLGCTMAILVMLLHSTVDFSLQAPANAILFITILALSWLCRFLPSERSTERSSTQSAT